MKNFYLFLLILVNTTFISANSGFPGRVSYDKFDKTTKYTGSVYNLGNGIKISFNSLNGDYFYIQISYTDDNWLFIRSGESLQLLLDNDHVISLRGDGSIGKRDATSKGIKEEAVYEVLVDDLKHINNSDKVEIKLIGDRYFKTERFTQFTKSGLSKFLFYFNIIGPGSIIEDELTNEDQSIKIENSLNDAIEKMNKELYKTSLFYYGNAFLISGIIGTVSGGVIAGVGYGLNNDTILGVGAFITAFILPLVPLSSIFYGVNYSNLKKKYLLKTSFSLNSNMFELSVKFSF